MTNRMCLSYHSAFTGQHCICLVCPRSRNRKTGPMVQVSFLVESEAPDAAAELGFDDGVCGSCAGRLWHDGWCYVQLVRAPLAQYKAYKRRAYAAGISSVHRPVRYGAYGDPASMTPRMFARLHEGLQPTTWAGYTHAWRERQDLQRFLMASVDSEKEAGEAKRKGWRYFRIKRQEERCLPGEIQCPAERTDKAVQCIDCGLCNGLAGKGPNVVINAHGKRAGRF